jgi:hypothetical protein
LASGNLPSTWGEGPRSQKIAKREGRGVYRGIDRSPRYGRCVGRETGPSDANAPENWPRSAVLMMADPEPRNTYDQVRLDMDSDTCRVGMAGTRPAPWGLCQEGKFDSQMDSLQNSMPTAARRGARGLCPIFYGPLGKAPQENSENNALTLLANWGARRPWGQIHLSGAPPEWPSGPRVEPLPMV